MKNKKARWLEVKGRGDQTIHEFLNDRNVYNNYTHETKGKKLTFDELASAYLLDVEGPNEIEVPKHV